MTFTDLHSLAVQHSAFLTYIIYAAIIIFLFLSVISLAKAKQKAAVHNIMRFAPSIMTALGLLGTFWGLTQALSDFGVEQNKIIVFMRQLEGIFVFSLLGIGSALFFMAINAIVNGIQAVSNRQLYQQRKDEETNYRKNAEDNNRQVVGNLTEQTKFADIQQQNSVKQSDYLHKIGGILLKKGQEYSTNYQATFDTLIQQNTLLENIANINNEQIRLQTQLPLSIENTNHLLGKIVAKSEKNNQDSQQQLSENNRLLMDIIHKQQAQLDQQSHFVQQLDQKFAMVVTALQAIDKGFDQETLGHAIGAHVRQALVEPLANISTPLEQMLTLMQNDNNDKIKQLIEQLKTDVLEPIKHEISTTNDSVIKVTQAVSESNETNQRMIGALNATVTTMNEVTQKTQAVVTNMDEMIERMETLRTQQKEDLNQFNRDLQTNLNSIKPLISEGMKEAEDSLVSAINTASDKMNGTLQDTQGHIQTVTGTMHGMIDRMETMQKDQTRNFDKFNTDLQTNLGKIEPAIENGMKNAETALTGAINTASDNMNKTLTTTQGHIQTVADGMNQTVMTMSHIQDQQKHALNDFNSKLKDNLDTIKPAITDSMKVAEVALTGAIALAMKEMNSTLKNTQNAMSEIIGQMSKDVLTRIENVLNSFNTGMDTQLNRMNTELEQTGNRASNLMTQTADNLERSLGDIHKTIHDSSNVLQKELQEFREQYQLNLNDFFDKQNKALEFTLGEQNKALQTTANELNTQFTNMTEAQRNLLKTQQDLNADLNRIKTEFDQVYSGLLIKMTTLADTLSKNENRYLKSLGDTNKEMQEINKALMDMGHQLPKEFATAFERLNEAYETRFNELNEKSHTFMGQIVAATGALIQTVTALKDQA